MKNYIDEREGQIEFFEAYQVPIDDQYSVLVDNTDGCYNGNLFEFKLNIADLNRVLFQAIKYLSELRIKGEPVPANILLVDLNNEKAYQYKSEDYRNYIQKVYHSSASKENSGFVGKNPSNTFVYSKMIDSSKLRRLIVGKKNKNEQYMPIDIDEDCIVGWAKKYYDGNPRATKGDFLGDYTGSRHKTTGEIREPHYFVNKINPYNGITNEKFKYLMDCLNDKLSKMELGAFYTPMAYAKKAAELVMKAVERVPVGNDYIILDRCAGTGNLEEGLIGLRDKNGDELISHCVVSTFEYYEYKVLQERIGSYVREVIPPTESNVIYDQGKIKNADALSEDFINNEIIKKYINDKKCTIILYENPPYADDSSYDFNENGDKTKKKITNKKNTYVALKYKESMSTLNEKNNSAQDTLNLFVWSGFEYYLRKKTDSYVLFGLVKYFKVVGLAKKKMIEGFIFNRKYFHATEAAVSCILWANENDPNQLSWNLKIFDLSDNKEDVVDLNQEIQIKRVDSPLSTLFDKRNIENAVQTTVVCKTTGYPDNNFRYSSGRRPIYSDDIIGYMHANAYPIRAANCYLVRCNWDSGLKKSQGFHLRSDNYKDYLSLFCAKLFPTPNWYDKEIYCTSADGGESYKDDPAFIKSCLIYTCLSTKNHCISFVGNDDRLYLNQLCFDEDTLASRDLLSYELDEEERELLNLWRRILQSSKTTHNYNPDYKYGPYQISNDLNTHHDEVNARGKIIYTPDYVLLNSDLNSLSSRLKNYYNTHLKAKMLEYQLVK